MATGLHLALTFLDWSGRFEEVSFTLLLSDLILYYKEFSCPDPDLGDPKRPDPDLDPDPQHIHGFHSDVLVLWELLD